MEPRGLELVNQKCKYGSIGGALEASLIVGVDFNLRLSTASTNNWV